MARPEHKLCGSANDSRGDGVAVYGQCRRTCRRNRIHGERFVTNNDFRNAGVVWIAWYRYHDPIDSSCFTWKESLGTNDDTTGISRVPRVLRVLRVLWIVRWNRRNRNHIVANSNRLSGNGCWILQDGICRWSSNSRRRIGIVRWWSVRRGIHRRSICWRNEQFWRLYGRP